MPQLSTPRAVWYTCLRARIVISDGKYALAVSRTPGKIHILNHSIRSAMVRLYAVMQFAQLWACPSGNAKAESDVMFPIRTPRYFTDSIIGMPLRSCLSLVT